MDIRDVINRTKQLQYFDVVIDLEESLQFNGVIPFDTIINDNVATFKVLAISYEEAEQRVFNFLWG